MNAANVAAAKPVNPTSLFTSEGLQASYQDLDKIFDNSDESNDTVCNYIFLLLIELGD